MTSPPLGALATARVARAEPGTPHALNALISASTPLVRGPTRAVLVMALGATAVLALADKPLPIAKSRGFADLLGCAGFITVHLSYLLRIPDRHAKEQGNRDYVSGPRRKRKLAARRDPSA